MEDGEDDYPLFLRDKENPIRKAPDQCPPQIFVNDGKLLRVAE